MKFDEVDADLIETAALLHNISMIGIPRDLLEKDEDSLSEDERRCSAIASPFPGHTLAKTP